jgi:hypothetical protein
MNKLFSILAGTLLLSTALLPLAAARAEQPAEMNIAAPELKDLDEWMNSKPLQLKDLRGRVVVLHFWTFG